MKKIKLHGNKYAHLFALVDDEDFEEVNQYKWYGQSSKRNKTIYAEANCWHGDKRTRMRMHRFILGLEFYNSKLSDHKDENGLNNQKYNLRIATNQQNMYNIAKQNGNYSSKYKGVNWKKSRKKWEAKINYNKKRYYLGYYDDEIDAAIAYDLTAYKLHGEFANLNEII